MPYGRQEPEIFEQPVGGCGDLELAAVPDEQYTGQTYVTGQTGLHTVITEEDASEEYHLFVFPEERRLGTWSTAFLIINRVVGTGIYSTPSSIIGYTDSVGATLLFWVLGGVMTFWCVLSSYSS
jgi:phosphatidylinositol 4-kinase